MKPIRQRDGSPYPTRDQAEMVRDALGRYTRQAFDTVPEVSGFVIKPRGKKGNPPTATPMEVTTPETIVVRLAVRGHLGLIGWLITGGAFLVVTSPLAEALASLPGPVGHTAAERVHIPFAGMLATAEVLMATFAMLILVTASVRLFLAMYYYRYELGPDAISAREGIIARQVRHMYYRNARIPTLKQGFLDRLLGIGAVTVSSAGGGQTGDIRIEGIRNPGDSKALIQERIEHQTPR